MKAPKEVRESETKMTDEDRTIDRAAQKAQFDFEDGNISVEDAQRICGIWNDLVDAKGFSSGIKRVYNIL